MKKNKSLPATNSSVSRIQIVLKKANGNIGRGFSVIEILVVIGVFSIISIVITQSLLSTFKNTRKTDNQIEVRENLNYILSIMERRLRNASKIKLPPDSPASTPQIIYYVDETGSDAMFSCTGLSGSGEVNDQNGQISSSEIDIESCNFIYTDLDPLNNVPQKIEINISAKARDSLDVEESLSSVSTVIYLRVY